MSRADEAAARTEAALKACGFADMRPVYRALLNRLRQKDAVLFDEATDRYEKAVGPALADADADPVAAWVAYGVWLATRLGDGRLVKLDATGLATPAAPEPVIGHVLLYLPEDGGASAIPLLRPAELSPAQQAALELLTG